MNAALDDSTRTLGVPPPGWDVSMGMSGSARATFGTGGSTLVDMTTTSDVSSEITSNIRRGSLAQYELLGVIGSGKFSTVYRAQAVEGPGQVVAIKKVQIFEIMDSKQRVDCVNEVKLLQSLDHRHIIRYLDSFIEDNELVIVLEWAEGGDLGRVLRQTQASATPLGEGPMWDFFVQVCDAVDQMHKKRMMHRDIKPSNVFLCRDGFVKLGDLGLSRYFSSKTAQARSMVGTPYYMSPECIRGQPYDWSSDVWSLGCLLYELATNRNPFYQDGLNYYTLGKLITSCEYAPLPPHLSDSVRTLVSQMIQGDPSRRPSVEQVLHFARGARERWLAEQQGAAANGANGNGVAHHQQQQQVLPPGGGGDAAMAEG